MQHISIVTPSLNQGRFIDATIRSVLEQGYPDLEYIIMDGGSTDGTLEILRKYGDRIRWVSEKDTGQTSAINKGMRLTSGEIRSYLNADDILLPGCLYHVSSLFSDHPDSLWLTGRCRIINGLGSRTHSLISLYKNLFLKLKRRSCLLITNFISQPATFWRTSLAERCGEFDESLHYVMDYEYWLRLWSTAPPLITSRELAGFRVHLESKTTSQGHNQGYIDEEQTIINRHTSSLMWRKIHDMHRFAMTTAYSLMSKHASM